jgi:hypothetical protein
MILKTIFIFKIFKYIEIGGTISPNVNEISVSTGNNKKFYLNLYKITFYI